MRNIYARSTYNISLQFESVKFTVIPKFRRAVKVNHWKKRSHAAFTSKCTQSVQMVCVSMLLSFTATYILQQKSTIIGWNPSSLGLLFLSAWNNRSLFIWCIIVENSLNQCSIKFRGQFFEWKKTPNSIPFYMILLAIWIMFSIAYLHFTKVKRRITHATQPSVEIIGFVWFAALIFIYLFSFLPYSMQWMPKYFRMMNNGHTINRIQNRCNKLVKS